MSDIEIRTDFSDALRDIRELKSSISDLRAEYERTRKATSGQFLIGGGESAVKEAESIERLRSEYQKLKQAAATLRGALNYSTDPQAIAKMAIELKKVTVAMSQYERVAQRVGVSLQEVKKNSGVVGELFAGFSKAAVILTAINYIKQFVSESIKLADQTARASKQFEAFLGNADKAKGKVADLRAFANQKILPTQEVLDAGRALLGFGEKAENLTPVLSRIADISRATGKNFNELTVIYGKARTQGVLYAEDINQLTEAGIPIIQQFAKQMGVSADKVKKLASEGRIGFAELELAFASLTAAGGKYAGQAEAGIQAGDRFAVAWEGFLSRIGTAIKPVSDAFKTWAADTIKDINDVFDAEKPRRFFSETFELLSRFSGALAIVRRFGILPDAGGVTTPNAAQSVVDTDKRAAYESARESNAELIELERKAADERKRLAQKNANDAVKTAAEIARLRVEAMREGEEKEIAAETLRHETLLKSLRKYGIDATEATEQYEKNIIEIKLKYLAERYSAEQEAAQTLNEIIDRGYDELNAIEEQEAARRVEFLSAQKSNLEATQEYQKAIFEGQILAAKEAFFSKKRTDKEIQEYEKQIAKAREIFTLEQQKKELELIIAYDKSLGGAEVAALEQRIKNINTAISQVQAGVGEQAAGDGESATIWSALGIDDEEQQRQFQQSVSFVISQLESLAAANKALADATLESAETRVQAAEDALDREIELAQAGFSNSVDLRRRELADAEAARNTALRQQQEAARKQLILQSLIQASSIATAAAETLETFNGPLLPVGIALVAAMIGAFIAAKVKAGNAARAQFREGGEIDSRGVIAGPSHDNGGVPFEAEGGEFITGDGRRISIVNKKMTGKHFELLQAINKDDRAGMRAALARLTGGPSIDRAAVISSIPGPASGGASINLDGFSRTEREQIIKYLKVISQGKESVSETTNFIIERRSGYVRKTKKQ